MHSGCQGITNHVVVDDIAAVLTNMEWYGGEIRVGSTPAESSTFFFTLPAA